MNQVVKWHNDIVRAFYNLDINAKKLMVGIALELQNKGYFQEKMSLDAFKIADRVGIDKTNLSRDLKKAVKDLVNRPIELQISENEWQVASSPFMFKGHYKNGILKVHLNDWIENVLFELAERYTSYHLENIKPLRSFYSVRIYEILKSHEKQRNKQCEYSLEDLRGIIGLTTEYKEYRDFKRRILEQAKKDLRESTDIKFTYKEEKLGRSVHKIIFTIKENSEEKEDRKKKREAQQRAKKMEESQLTLEQIVNFSQEEAKDFAEKIAKKVRGEKTEEPDMFKKTQSTEEPERRVVSDLIIPTGKRKIDQEWRKKRGVETKG